jgi:hypothetical protein
MLLIGIRSGVFYTPPSRIAEVMASQDSWLIFRFTTREAVTNSVYFGMITLIAVMWDKWWLTGPLAVLMAVMLLPTIIQGLVIIVTTISVIVINPGSIVPVVATAVVRLTGDVLALFYFGLMFTALLT